MLKLKKTRMPENLLNIMENFLANKSKRVVISRQVFNGL